MSTPSDSTVELRAAKPGDAEAIAEVNLAAGRAGWAAFIPDAHLAGLELSAERWRERLAEPASSSAVIVACERGEVIGFASLATAGEGTGVGEVRALYTHPLVWGRGAGRALLDAALERLRSSGCREAVLWTEERNRRPLRVYERAGWWRDGGRRERDFLGHPICEVRLRISLEPEASRRDRPLPDRA